MKGRALFTRGPLASGCIAKIDRFVEQLLKKTPGLFSIDRPQADCAWAQEIPGEIRPFTADNSLAVRRRRLQSYKFPDWPSGTVISGQLTLALRLSTGYECGLPNQALTDGSVSHS